jgi:hypothetical protein
LQLGSAGSPGFFVGDWRSVVCFAEWGELGRVFGKFFWGLLDFFQPRDIAAL